MKHHGRTPWRAPHELDAAQRAVYDAIVAGPRGAGPQAFALTDGDGRLEGPFNALLLTAGLGACVQELGAAIRYRGSLPDRAREIAILELAVLRGCEFEWYAHERIGRRAGLNDGELAAVRTGRPAVTMSDAETTVRSIVRNLVVDRDIDDAAFAAAETQLGASTLMELIILVGYYDMLALSMRVWRTPLPVGASASLARTRHE